MYLYSYENLLEQSTTKKGREYVEKVKACYEQNYQNKPITALPFSKFKLFHLTGDRVSFESEYFDRRKRLMLLQVLAITDNKYLEPLEDVISSICDEITWSLPAHCFDYETQTYKYWEIDLNASETSMALAETLYVFGERLSPDIRKRIKYTIEEKIVKVYERTVFGFDVMRNNWASVCSCGIGVTYLYLFPERFNLVKDRIFKAMERYLNKLDADGYCNEGFAYWVYGFGFFALFFDIYCQLTGERPAILDSERVKNTVKYAENSILGDGVYVPISDGGVNKNYCECDCIPVINRMFNSNIQINGGKSSVPYFKAISLRRLYHANQIVNLEIKSGTTNFFENSQVFIEKNKNYVFIAKGGNNAEMHNHNDIGAFSIFRKGVQYIVDPGAGEYTNGYFNNMAIRYSKETFTCSGYGHSIPVIDGEVQVYGKEYYATIIDRDAKSITYDLVNAYPKKLDKLTVKYSLKENGVSVTYNVKGLKEQISFRFVSFIEPKIEKDCVRLGEMVVSSSVAVPATVENYEFSNHHAQKTKAYVTCFTVKGEKETCATFNFDF